MGSNPFANLQGMKDNLEAAGDTSAAIDISGSLTPWAKRPKTSGQFWSGMNETEALGKAQDVHNFIQQNRGINTAEAERFVQRELQFSPQETKKFVKTAQSPSQASRFAEFGVAHTAAGEEMYADWMRQSGNETRMLAQGTGDPQVTDLINKGDDLVDVQNRYLGYRNTQDSLNIEALKPFRGSNPTQYFNAYDDDAPVGEIIEEFKKRYGWGDGKLLQTPYGAAIGPNDRNMRTKASTYGKNKLIGGIYEPNSFTNQIQYNKGPYNPQVPRRVYSVDLPELRTNLFNTRKGDLKDLGIQIPERKGLSFEIPLEHIRKYGGGTNPIDHGLISKDVAKAVKASRPGGVEMFGGIPTPGQTGLQLPKSKGRMAGERLVKGGVLADVAITGGLSYLTGESENAGQAAWAGATSLIPDAGGTANIKDIGGKLYSYDQSTNMVTPLAGGKTQGLAYKDGKTVAVDYGSLKGRTSMVDDVVTPIKAIGQQISDTYKRREAERKPIKTVGKSRYSQRTKAKPVRPTTSEGWWEQAQNVVLGIFK